MELEALCSLFSFKTETLRSVTSHSCIWDSPFADFGVLALSAERYDLKLHCTLLQKKKKTEEASPSCIVVKLLIPGANLKSGSYLAHVMGRWLQTH